MSKKSTVKSSASGFSFDYSVALSVRNDRSRAKVKHSGKEG